jgi:hypothetical protein
MVGSGMEIIGQGFVRWMLGVPVYVSMKWHRDRDQSISLQMELRPESAPARKVTTVSR